MNDREIDQALQERAAQPVDPALLNRISASLRSDLRPVRPLPSVWLLVAGLVALSSALALAEAAYRGLFGIERLSAVRIGAIFPALAILILVAARLSVSAKTPGSKRLIQPGTLLAAGTLGLVVIFYGIFNDPRMDNFIPGGTACLIAGLVCAVPVGIASWLILRRGLAVSAMQAGLAVGTVAGLAGVIMLELHCPNFRTMHIVVWHTAVIPLSGMAAAAIAQALRKKRSAAELMQ